MDEIWRYPPILANHEGLRNKSGHHKDAKTHDLPKIKNNYKKQQIHAMVVICCNHQTSKTPKKQVLGFVRATPSPRLLIAHCHVGPPFR